MFKNNYIKQSNHTFNIHADKKFYLYNNSDIIIKQLFDREYLNMFNKWIDIKDIIFQDLLNDENKTKHDICKYIAQIMNFKKIKKNINYWNEFLSSSKIYEKIINII